jgi:hypothetical protein
MMKKLILVFILALSGVASHNFYGADIVSISDSDIEKILKAKDIVRAMVNYPDTLVFHEFHTLVKGNTVTLKFSCKNAFGVSETHTLDIPVN